MRVEDIIPRAIAWTGLRMSAGVPETLCRVAGLVH